MGYKQDLLDEVQRCREHPAKAFLQYIGMGAMVAIGVVADYYCGPDRQNEVILQIEVPAILGQEPPTQ